MMMAKQKGLQRATADKPCTSTLAAAKREAMAKLASKSVLGKQAAEGEKAR
jgi:hypothetical protein